MNNETAHRPILVGFDGSDRSLIALDWALDEAVLRGLPVHVITSRGLPLAAAPGLIEPSLFPEDEAEKIVEEARAHAAERSPGVRVTTSTDVGSPAAVLLRYSKQASAIVVGRGPHSAIGEAILGSTSAQVTAHASCPVIIVDDAAHTGAVGAVVVGVDGSPANEPALAYAFEQASLRKAGLVAVHAWWVDVPMRVPATWVTEDTMSRIGQDREAMLATTLAGWSQKYPDVPVRSVVARARAVDTLVETAGAGDLIVVGSRGHGGFVGLLLGSVSQGLLHREHPCPLAVVHSPS